MKVLKPSFRRRVVLGEACALFSLAVLIFAVAGRSSTLAVEVLRRDAAPSGVFDSLVTTNSAQPNAPCAGVAAVRWLPKTNVTISFVRGDFTDSEKSALREAIDLWQRAVSKTPLAITFAMGAEVEQSFTPASGAIVVRRDYQMEDGKYGRIIASARPDNYLDRASILVSGAIHEKKILRKLMMHELGHALGLRDCSDCGSGKSVMNYFSRKSILGFSIHDKSVAGKPSASDIAQVEAGYRQAATTQPQVGSNGSAESQTVVADEHLIAVAGTTTVAEQNILAPFLSGGHLPVGSYVSRVLTPDEQTRVQSQLPKLLQVEAETMDALKNYSFKREVRIQTIDAKGRVSGEYHRVSDMVFDDEGRRVERNLSFSKPTLSGLKITSEYVEDFSGAQLKGFELSQRDAYRFEPFGFETLNGKSVRVYRITPVNLEAAKATGARVLYGFAWVDEQTGAILKVAGRALPELKQRYPLFETHRELVDEKHLFPVRTLADDYLVFPSRRVHVRMLITYSNYKRFAARVSIVDLDEPQP
ncbi:MAG TPA: hypothetical protein VFZ40_15220 [Pyrinomonadaceae bacterium]